jgi:hypothetical protein
VQPRHPGIPRATVFTLIRSLPGDRLSCPRDRRIIITAGVTPASGCQDAATSRPPTAVRPHVPRRAAATSGHRLPTSRVLTIAIRPSCRGGMEGGKHEFWKTETGIFLREGLDSESDVERIEEISVLAHASAMRFRSQRGTGERASSAPYVS